MLRRGSCCEHRCLPGSVRFLKMKTPPSRQAQFELVERLVAGILQRVFRLHSNARLWSRNKLHAQLLPFDGVPGTKRRNAPRRPEARHCRKGCIRKTRLDSSAQSNLIVSGKSQKQKQRATVCSLRNCPRLSLPHCAKIPSARASRIQKNAEDSNQSGATCGVRAHA